MVSVEHTSARTRGDGEPERAGPEPDAMPHGRTPSAPSADGNAMRPGAACVDQIGFGARRDYPAEARSMPRRGLCAL